MKDLIEALQILSKYTTADQPTRCEYETLQVLVNLAIVSFEDITRLAQLGFYAGPVEAQGDSNVDTHMVRAIPARKVITCFFMVFLKAS
jgi:hypothetical protein